MNLNRLTIPQTNRLAYPINTINNPQKLFIQEKLNPTRLNKGIKYNPSPFKKKI